MNRRAPWLFALALALAAGTASASSIGVFFAPDGSDCDATQLPFAPATAYVIALLGGDAAAGGITGAELRLSGIPAGWFPSAVANAAATLSLGNLVGAGTNIAFNTCQSGPLVLLYTINYFVATTENSLTFSVLRHDAPSNPDFLCPLLVLCDLPVYSKVCVPGGQALVNGRACTVGVQPTTWSQVKGLYRE